MSFAHKESFCPQEHKYYLITEEQKDKCTSLSMKILVYAFFL